VHVRRDQVNGLLVIRYNLGDRVEDFLQLRDRRPAVSRLDDAQYHYVTIIRRDNKLSVQVDDWAAQNRTHGLYISENSEAILGLFFRLLFGVLYLLVFLHCDL